MKPPSELSPASRRRFREFTREYGIEDNGGMAILRSALRALDLAERAEAEVEKDGLVVLDRFGAKRSHPLLPLARDYRAQYLSGLRALNLAVGDAPKVGRPEGA